MADIAALGIEIRSEQVKTATQDLDRMTVSAGKTEQATGALAAAAKRANISIQEMQARTQAFNTQTLTNSRAVTQANDRALKAVNDNNSAVSGLSGSMGRALGVLGVFGIGLHSAFQLATELYDYLKQQGPTVEKTFQEQNRLLGVIKDSYDKVSQSAKTWLDQSKDVTQLQLLQQQIDLQTKLHDAVGKGISGATTFGNIGDFISGTKQIKENLLPFEDALFKLQDGFKQGTPSVREFVDEVARIALLNPALQKLGADLVNSVGDASKFENSLKQIDAAMKLIKGNSLSSDDRGRLGLPETRTAAAPDPFGSQVISIQKHIAAVKADAEAVGQSVGEHARLRTEAALLEAAQQKGATVTDIQREKIAQLGSAARDAADSLANIRLDNDIKFNFDTAFLSDADKKIASILRQVKGDDWQNFMKGPQADAIRLNTSLENINATIRQSGENLAQDFVAGIMSGKSAMESLSNAAQSLSQSLAKGALKSLFSGQFLEAAVQGIGASIGGTFGNDQKRKPIANDNEPVENEERKAA